MRSMLKPEQWDRLASEATLDDRTIGKLAKREWVRTSTQTRVKRAAERAGISLPRGFFAAAPDESAA